MIYILWVLLFLATVGQFFGMTMNLFQADYADVFANLGGGVAFSVLFGVVTTIIMRERRA